MVRRKGNWLRDEALRALVNSGRKNTEIAQINKDVCGFEPLPSSVSKRLRRIGAPPRKISHKDLIWWRIRPEHCHDPIYYGLQALDREIKQVPLSSQDYDRAELLKDILRHRSGPWVVDYQPDQYPEHGFILVKATETEKATGAIVRRPPT